MANEKWHSNDDTRDYQFDIRSKIRAAVETCDEKERHDPRTRERRGRSTSQQEALLEKYVDDIAVSKNEVDAAVELVHEGDALTQECVIELLALRAEELEDAISGSALFDILADQLASDDDETVVTALRAVARLPNSFSALSSAAIVNALVRRLLSADAALRALAARTVTSLVEVEVASTTTAGHDRNARARNARALVDAGVLPALLEVLDDSALEVRYNAIKALRKILDIGYKKEALDEAAMERIIRLFGDEDDDVRILVLACSVSLAIASEKREVVERLQSILDADDAKVRQSAVRVLGWLYLENEDGTVLDRRMADGGCGDGTTPRKRIGIGDRHDDHRSHSCGFQRRARRRGHTGSIVPPVG